jgi:cell division protein FtsI/penicillin-binding protein 2
MMRFYAALAGDGTMTAPYLVKRADSTKLSLGLDSAQLAGIRAALSDVVQRGTAAASGGREIDMAGKTGTAQNPHGPDHGWFIGFAPATNPRIIVGSIMEFKLHGTVVAPYVAQVIRRFLAEQNPELSKSKIRFSVVEDSVPAPREIPPDTIRPAIRQIRPPR